MPIDFRVKFKLFNVMYKLLHRLVSEEPQTTPYIVPPTYHSIYPEPLAVLNQPESPMSRPLNMMLLAYSAVPEIANFQVIQDSALNLGLI